MNEDEIKKYIEDNYCVYDLENTYHDYDNNPRLDDCFQGGYDKGYSKALYDMGIMLGMKLEESESDINE